MLSDLHAPPGFGHPPADEPANLRAGVKPPDRIWSSGLSRNDGNNVQYPYSDGFAAFQRGFEFGKTGGTAKLGGDGVNQ